MNIPNIDSKIMARAFALALSVEHRKALFMGNDKYSPNKTVVDIAKEYEKYLIGDANLPEVREDHTKRLADLLNGFEKEANEISKKRDKEWKEFMSNIAKEIDGGNVKLGIK